MPRRLDHRPAGPLSRRDLLRLAGGGFGAWALLDLLTRDGLVPGTAAEADPKPPPPPARARQVISLFMQGGPSHIDTFDPKPLLNKLHGQALPASVTRGLQLQFTGMDAAI